jgi:hypothetical protein
LRDLIRAHVLDRLLNGGDYDDRIGPDRVLFPETAQNLPLDFGTSRFFAHIASRILELNILICDELTKRRRSIDGIS